MIELLDELGREHIRAIRLLESVKRDDRFGDLLSTDLMENRQPERRLMNRPITCWNAEVWGDTDWCPETLRVRQISTTDMKTRKPVAVKMMPNSPTHVLAINGDALSRLKDLGLVSVKWHDAYGNLRLLNGRSTQAPLFTVFLTDRGNDLLTRKALLALCRWMLPLGMRRRAMAVVVACSSASLLVDLSWILVVGAMILLTFGWHYGAVWWTWQKELPRSVRRKINTGQDQISIKEMTKRDLPLAGDADLDVYVTPSAVRWD